MQRESDGLSVDFLNLDRERVVQWLTKAKIFSHRSASVHRRGKSYNNKTDFRQLASTADTRAALTFQSVIKASPFVLTARGWC